MGPPPPEKEMGRKVMTVAEDYCWTQRIETEERERRKAPRNEFSVRAATNSAGVPLKFKPSQTDPTKPETISDVIATWSDDKDGTMAKEVRKCIATEGSLPIDRKPYTENSSQEVGWAGALGGGCDPVKLKEHGKRLNRFFHPHMQVGQSSVGVARRPDGAATGSRRSPADPGKVGSDFSSQKNSTLRRSTGSLPLAGSGTSAEAALQEERASEVSVVVPSELSCNASLVGSLRRSASFVAASEVSLAAPSQLSQAGSSQLPSMTEDAVAWLRRREAGVARALEESNKYLAYGRYGKRYSRPLLETDATSFQAAFTKATGGIPLHKYGR